MFATSHFKIYPWVDCQVYTGKYDTMEVCNTFSATDLEIKMLLFIVICKIF